MSLEEDLRDRSAGVRELCGSAADLDRYTVPHSSIDTPAATHIFTCVTCRTPLNDAQQIEANHWFCLNDSRWSQLPAA